MLFSLISAIRFRMEHARLVREQERKASLYPRIAAGTIQDRVLRSLWYMGQITRHGVAAYGSKNPTAVLSELRRLGYIKRTTRHGNGPTVYIFNENLAREVESR